MIDVVHPLSPADLHTLVLELARNPTTRAEARDIADAMHDTLIERDIPPDGAERYDHLRDLGFWGGMWLALMTVENGDREARETAAIQRKYRVPRARRSKAAA